MSSIKIGNNKHGYYLKVNGCFIRREFNGDIKAIKSQFSDPPWGTTDWVNISSIQKFWKESRIFIVAATTRPYRSVWGQLELIEPVDSPKKYGEFIERILTLDESQLDKEIAETKGRIDKMITRHQSENN